MKEKPCIPLLFCPFLVSGAVTLLVSCASAGTGVRITGTDSLQDSDAADALVCAFSNPETYEDTYTIIPFTVTDSGSSESGHQMLQPPRHDRLRSSMPCSGGLSLRQWESLSGTGIKDPE